MDLIDMENNLQELQNKLLEMLLDFDKFCRENEIEYTLSGGNVLGAVRHKGFIPWDDDLDVFLTRENYNKFLAIYKNNEKYTLQKDTVDYPLQFSKLRLNNSTFIENISYRKKYKNIHQGIFIDIFPVDKVAKNKIKAKIQTLCSYVVITQSLFLRGYQRLNFKKRIAIFFAICLLPFKKFFINYVKGFNNQTDFEYYCSYYGMRRKVYQDKDNFSAPFTMLDYEGYQFPVMKNYKKYLEDVYGDYMQIPSKEQIEYNIHAKIFKVNEDYTKYLS